MIISSKRISSKENNGPDRRIVIHDITNKRLHACLDQHGNVCVSVDGDKRIAENSYYHNDP